MNKYQRMAFGVAAVLVVAYLLQDQLLKLALAAGIIALLTLATTWKVFFTGTQASGHAISFTGHAVGKLGDMVIDGSRNIKAHLAMPVAVPGWDELMAEPSMPGKVEVNDDLDVPDFLKGDETPQPSHTQDAGLSIFDSPSDPDGAA